MNDPNKIFEYFTDRLSRKKKKKKRNNTDENTALGLHIYTITESCLNIRLIIAKPSGLFIPAPVSVASTFSLESALIHLADEH